MYRSPKSFFKILTFYTQCHYIRCLVQLEINEIFIIHAEKSIFKH